MDYFLGATHNSSDLSGTWIPQIPRWALLKYTSEGDRILANFLGRGTDAIECLLLRRLVVGVDVNRQCLAMAVQNCTLLDAKVGLADIRLGDATSVPEVRDGTCALVLSHPPYYRCVQYSSGNEAPGDLSRLATPISFCEKMSSVAGETFRVLHGGGRAVVGIGDNREARLLLPVSLWVLEVYLNSGLILNEYVLLPLTFIGFQI